MGFFSDIGGFLADPIGSALGAVGLGAPGGGIGGLFGSGDGSDAGSQAGQLEAQASQNAIKELRRQFDITQGNLQPFVDVGTEALPGLAGASTAGGLDQRFAELADTDIFKTLFGERTRAVQKQLGATGLSRSGTGLREIANVPTDILLFLEQLTGNRLANLAGSGQNAASGLGGLGAENAGNIAGFTQDIGRARGSGLIVDQQADAARQGQFLNAGATIGSALLFSDPRLKKNAKPVGKVKNLTLHVWDWIDEVKDTIVDTCEGLGFMSDEVKEKYPHHVYEFGGFDIIDYPCLLNELEAA